MACKRSAVRSRVAPPNSCDKKQKGHRIAVAFLLYENFISPAEQCGRSATILHSLVQEGWYQLWQLSLSTMRSWKAATVKKP